LAGGSATFGNEIGGMGDIEGNQMDTFTLFVFSSSAFFRFQTADQKNHNFFIGLSKI